MHNTDYAGNGMTYAKKHVKCNIDGQIIQYDYCMSMVVTCMNDVVLCLPWHHQKQYTRLNNLVVKDVRVCFICECPRHIPLQSFDKDVFALCAQMLKQRLPTSLAGGMQEVILFATDGCRVYGMDAAYLLPYLLLYSTATFMQKIIRLKLLQHRH